MAKSTTKWDEPPEIEKAPLSALSGAPIRTAHESVKDRIRTGILAGELPAGTRLVQSELGERLSVSITPVREALRDLSTEGLVDFDAFRGAVVHEPTTKELEDIYEIRMQLMPLNVRLGVAGIRQEELAELKDLLRAMEEAESQAIWVNVNRRFHQVMDGATRNPRLSTVMGQLSDLSALYVNLSVGVRASRRASADAEHRELCDLYAMGEVARATEVSLQHLRATVDAARAAFPGGAEVIENQNKRK